VESGNPWHYAITSKVPLKFIHIDLLNRTIEFINARKNSCRILVPGGYLICQRKLGGRFLQITAGESGYFSMLVYCHRSTGRSTHNIKHCVGDASSWQRGIWILSSYFALFSTRSLSHVSWGKSVVWRSDAIPQVGVDGKNYDSFFNPDDKCRRAPKHRSQAIVWRLSGYWPEIASRNI
jgi:hypothetical protein